MIFWLFDFIFNKWTVRPLHFYLKTINKKGLKTYRNKRKLKHGISHFCRHHDWFFLLVFLLNWVSLDMSVLDDSLELFITDSVYYVEEIFSVNLLSFWNFVGKVLLEVLSFWKVVIKMLDTYFLEVSDVNRLEFWKLQKPFLTDKYWF